MDCFDTKQLEIPSKCISLVSGAAGKQLSQAAWEGRLPQLPSQALVPLRQLQAMAEHVQSKDPQ